MHCGDCRFWYQPAQQCRRHAPLPLMQQTSERRTAWPHVAGEDWCGEYQPGYIDRPQPGRETRAQPSAH